MRILNLFACLFNFFAIWFIIFMAKGELDNIGTLLIGINGFLGCLNLSIVLTSGKHD